MVEKMMAGMVHKSACQVPQMKQRIVRMMERVKK